jgi:hypothetical protein
MTSNLTVTMKFQFLYPVGDNEKRKIMVFCDVMQCSLVHGKENFLSALKKEAAECSEMLMPK